ncbi:Retrovirus-related Pol polyprotein from type-1 retrotransposable element R1 4 [Eumeta japonica]|uniref:Retrovirus-related Pol polyprotein from type-1 retrotransposable element R1 4 n=1 Tax=Eumeta variegata TaxID=151549 RepID=A0A4C1YG49_EUMVA|nr:Retrovirus-related Pol polyprotein from type-1 retrotransposable element R1 4 [Eumeta japonica]
MNGRELYRYFADVSARLSSPCIEPDYETSQLLTGHGCFRKRLHELGLNESSVCLCEQTDEHKHHVSWLCPLYDDIRREMLRVSGICACLAQIARRAKVKQSRRKKSCSVTKFIL